MLLPLEGHIAGAGFPAVTYTDRPWRHSGTYRSPNLPGIADLDITLPPELDQAVADATERMRTFDSDSSDLTGPWAAALLHAEAVTSSEIEHLNAPLRDIALATLGDTSSANATQVARNTDAMRAAIELADQMDVDAIAAMHHRLMRGVDPHAGELRNQLVWIGGYSPVNARHVGPEHDRVPRHLDDLVRFVRRDNIPPLVQAAVAHAQFETIHPFTDGNGRTGRALVTSILRGRGVTRNLSVPLSAGLLVDTGSYFDALQVYREGNPGPIVDRFAAAVEDSLANAAILRRDIRTARDEMLAVAERRTAGLAATVDFCLTEPAFNADLVAARTGLPTATVYRHIARLEAAGMVRRERKLHGEQVWTVSPVREALDAFAARAGGRTWR